MKTLERWAAIGLVCASVGASAQMGAYEVASNSQAPDSARTSPTSVNASVCFSPAQVATGTKQILRFRYTNDGEIVRTTETRIEVQGRQTFNGQNATARNTSMRFLTGDAAGTESGTLSFLRVRSLEVLTLGSVTRAGVRGWNSAVTTVFEPPIVFSYSLARGESVVTATKATETTTWFPSAPPPTHFSETVSYTFLGFDDVTVPAGRFSGACKWTVSILRKGVKTTSTRWVTRNGVLVKIVTGPEIGELTSGTVNGGPVGP